MHYNTLFQYRNLNNFLGRGTAPPQTPSHPLGAYGASIVAPSALHTSRFRPVLCVPYFQCRLLATLTVTNVVQGKRSQRWKFTGPPPIKNPRYANDSACAYCITLSSFTYYIFTMLHCLSVLDNVEGRGGMGKPTFWLLPPPMHIVVHCANLVG